MGWVVSSWDRARARGTIASDVGELAFDAAVADVDDFEVGETVEVTLVARGESYVVTRVWPLAWRRPPSPVERTGMDLAEIVAVIRDRDLTVVRYDEDALVLAIRLDSYVPERTLEFVACRLVQLPPAIEDVATIRAFSPEPFARSCPGLVAYWPALDANDTVFRIEPRFFRQAAGYVVAREARLAGR